MSTSRPPSNNGNTKMLIWEGCISTSIRRAPARKGALSYCPKWTWLRGEEISVGHKETLLHREGYCVVRRSISRTLSNADLSLLTWEGVILSDPTYPAEAELCPTSLPIAKDGDGK